MAIEFACASCHEPVRVGDAAAGKKGKCPHCGAIMQIPAPGESQPHSMALSTPASPSGASPGAAAGPAKKQNIAFLCPSCTKTVHAPAAMAGKRGKCPHCQSLLIIGGGAVPPSTPAQATTPGLTPIGSGLTPLGDGLTPLGHGLTPLGDGLMPLDSGLTPLNAAPAPAGALSGRLPNISSQLDDIPTLTPLAGPAAGITPLPASPFGASPLGAAPSYAAPNPLGTPVGGYTLPAANLSSYTTPAYRGRSGTIAPPKLMVPAIAMIGVSTITILFSLYQATMLFLTPIVLPPNLRANPAEVQGFIAGVFTAYLVSFGVMILINAIVTFGSVQMIRMRGLGSAKTAGVLGLMPCSVCCLNFPFAIWALVVLGQDDVWRRFQG